MDSDASIFPLKADPRSFPALFIRILSHVFSLLKNCVDAVVPDRDDLTFSKDVCDGDRTSAEALVQVENAFLEVIRILRV